MTMSRRGVVAAMLLLASLGCRGAAPAVIEEGATSSAPASGGSGSGAAGLLSLVSDVTGGGTRIVYVKDPSLNNMNAFAITIPAKWVFAGTLYQGGNCVQQPAVVSRVTSPDGLSLAETLPPFGWVYGTGPRAQAASDCLAVTGPMSPEELLKRVAAMLHVEPAGPDPEVAAVQARVQQQRSLPGMTRQVAAILVRSQNGTFKIKGSLTTLITCQEVHNPGMRSMLQGMASIPPSDFTKCVAFVTHISAPENQFESVSRTWHKPEMGAHGAETPWFDAYIKRSNDMNQAVIARGNAMAEASRAQSAQQFAGMQARAQQFQADQQVRQQMHDQFLSTMQRGTDMSMARANSAMQARSTATSNIVDYALDRQTVVDPGTGQVSKVSSSYTTTWIDSTGKNSYQTNYSGANPNGSLPGTWVKQTVTNGDGTPK